MVDWEKKREGLKKKWNDVDRFFDFWNTAGFVLLIALPSIAFLWTLVWGRDYLSSILALLTGVYAFTSFNQMREARGRSYSKPVQRDIEDDEEYSAEVPVIRNFGSEAAYDVELLASLESDHTESIVTRRITKLESPTTLEPGEYEPVIDDLERFREDLERISDLDGAQLSLYYSYSTPSIPRIPPDESELLEKSLEELQEEYPEPTCFDAGTLRQRCFGDD